MNGVGIDLIVILATRAPIQCGRVYGVLSCEYYLYDFLHFSNFACLACSSDCLGGS